MQITTCLLLFLTLTINTCHGQGASNSALRDQPSGTRSTIASQYYGITKRESNVDTSSGWEQGGQKILLTGTVYRPDGQTPAAGVLLYYYQTDTKGKYVHRPGDVRSMPPNSLGQTHGYIRGWVKTDSAGKYCIYTVRPGAYPDGEEPAHIHVTVKEPEEREEYYIDDFVFDDDRLLTSAKRKQMENRGGSGILRLVGGRDLLVGERDIILGLNISSYPKAEAPVNSGIEIGEDVMSFTPFHAWGPDRGTKTCPVCKYGWYQGVLYFVGDYPNWADVKSWLRFFEAETKKREKYLKVYFIFGSTVGYAKEYRENQLQQLGEELGLENTALTFVPSFSDTSSEISFLKINQEVENTILLYKRTLQQWISKMETIFEKDIGSLCQA